MTQVRVDGPSYLIYLTRRRFMGLSLGAIGGAAIVAACGSSSSSTSTSGSGSKALIPIKIVNAAATLDLALQTVLEAHGWLKEFGVDAQTTNVISGTTMLSALVAGDGDIVVLSGFSQVFAAAQKGVPAKVLGVTGLVAPEAIFTANPDIKTIKNLVGKSVGTGAIGALQHQIMLGVLQKAGVDRNSVQFVNIGTLDEIFKAVVAKKVDAGAGDSSHVSRASSLGVRVISQVWKDLPDFANNGAYATTKAIQEKRDGLIGVLAAYIKLFHYISSPASKQEFADAYKKAGSTAEDGISLWQFWQDTKYFPLDLNFTQAQNDYMQRLNIASMTQTSTVPYSKVVDLSLAKEAVKLANK